MMSPRAKFLALIGIAVAPVVASYLLFFYVRDFSYLRDADSVGGGWATTNQGELLSPPPLVAELGWTSASDAATPATLGAAHWWLLVVARDACEAACAQAVLQLRQLHVLLNRDAGRVRRGVVFDASVAPEAVRDLAARYPKVEQWITPAGGSDARLGEGVYIVDPHGNVILRYRYEDTGKPVLEDLRKLLKASQIG